MAREIRTTTEWVDLPRGFERLNPKQYSNQQLTQHQLEEMRSDINAVIERMMHLEDTYGYPMVLDIERRELRGSQSEGTQESPI